MATDVQDYVQNCPTCSAWKTYLPRSRTPLQIYQAGALMDRVYMDILGLLPEMENGNRYVLVIIDQSMCYVKAYPLCEQSAETVARKYVYDFVSRFGTPLEVYTDQGTNLCSLLLRHVLELCQDPHNSIPPSMWAKTNMSGNAIFHS